MEDGIKTAQTGGRHRITKQEAGEQFWSQALSYNNSLLGDVRCSTRTILTSSEGSSPDDQQTSLWAPLLKRLSVVPVYPIL
jgi:hypothetical protein